MNLALAGPSLPWTAGGLLGGLLAFLAAAVLHPWLLPVLGAAATASVALALAAPWRRFHAAPAYTAFIGS